MKMSATSDPPELGLFLRGKAGITGEKFRFQGLIPEAIEKCRSRMIPKSFPLVLLLYSWFLSVLNGEIIETHGIRIENVTPSEVIVLPREVQGDFHNPKKEDSKISSISIRKTPGAVIVKVGSSVGASELSFEGGLGVTNIVWGRDIVVLMVRRFHLGGSSPSFLAVFSVKDNKNEIHYIKATNKEKEFKICDIVEIKEDGIRVEVAVGSTKYKYIFGDVKMSSLAHSDAMPSDALE